MIKFEDTINDKQRILAHLRRVSKEIDKLIQDFKSHSFGVGDIENRLHWAIRGVDPYASICIRHNQKIMKNIFGEYSCCECVSEYFYDRTPIDENRWYDLDDKPLLKIRGKY